TPTCLPRGASSRVAPGRRSRCGSACSSCSTVAHLAADARQVSPLGIDAGRLTVRGGAEAKGPQARQRRGGVSIWPLDGREMRAMSDNTNLDRPAAASSLEAELAQ